MTTSDITQTARICQRLAIDCYNTNVSIAEVQDFIVRLLVERNLRECCRRGIITSTEAATVLVAHFDKWIEDKSRIDIDTKEITDKVVHDIEVVLFSDQAPAADQ